ncbi:MAG: transcriptional regulator [Planctomycetaceae bacterium]|nr:transcriptional regulator [Planctomycetaceae bacterium]
MVATELKRWRELMGGTQRDAASSLEVSEETYRNMENGTNPISRRTELACLALYIGPDKLQAPWLHQSSS